MLARLHRAGELTEVWVPDAAHAMRDLVRARATAMKVLSKARQHLGGFLLRHGRIHSGVRTWTQAYRRWLTTVRFDHPAQQIVLQDYIDAVTDAERRVDRVTRQISEHLPGWSMAPVATAMCLAVKVALAVAAARRRFIRAVLGAEALHRRPGPPPGGGRKQGRQAKSHPRGITHRKAGWLATDCDREGQLIGQKFSSIMSTAVK
jgi:hypothetical protein